MNIVDFLQNHTASTKQTAAFRHARFSEQAGEDVIFQIRALSFDELEEIKRCHEEDSEVYSLLEGVVEPSLKNPELLRKYKVSGYDELVKAIFLPGEITRISSQIVALSGFRKDTIEEIKKN